MNKQFRVIPSKLANLYHNANARIAVALVPLTTAGGAFAQTSAAVEAYNDAKDAVSADVLVFAGGLVAIAAIAVGFMVGVKYVKKIGGAA